MKQLRSNELLMVFFVLNDNAAETFWCFFFLMELLLVELQISDQRCMQVQLGSFRSGLLAIAEVLEKKLFFLTLTGSSYKADYEAVLHGGKNICMMQGMLKRANTHKISR